MTLDELLERCRYVRTLGPSEARPREFVTADAVVLMLGEPQNLGASAFATSPGADGLRGVACSLLTDDLLPEEARALAAMLLRAADEAERR